MQALHLNIVRKGNYGKQRMCSAFVEVGSSGDVTRLCQRLNGLHNFLVAEVPLLVEAAEPRRGGKGVPPAGWKGAAPKAPAAPAPAPAAPAPAAPKQAPAAPKQAPAAPKAAAAAPKAAAAASASVLSPTSRAVSGEEDEESAERSSSSDAAGSDTEPPSPGIVVARYAKRRKLQYTPTEPGDVEPGVKSDSSSSCS